MNPLEPRPRLGPRKRRTLFILLIMAFTGFAALSILAPAPVISGKLLKGGEIILKPQAAAWYRAILVSLCTSIFTISMYELASAMLQWGIWERFDRKEFDQFFGDDASGCCGKGVIFLQSDKIDALLKEYGVPDIKEKIDSNPKGRLFKAREWMNHFDTQGARKIITRFRDLGLDPPQLMPVDRAEEVKEANQQKPPFTITMGLGFSTQTDKLIASACSGWMRVDYDDVYGDVLELLHHFVQRDLKGLEVKDVGDFRRLLPINKWSLAAWLESPADVRDYALILRHTESDDYQRRPKFVLAGFTERGTAAAGEYLAQNWRSLWKDYVRDFYDQEGLGDFLLVIEGPSDWKDIKEWAPVQNLNAVTPQRLALEAGSLDTAWVRRFKSQRPENSVGRHYGKRKGSFLSNIFKPRS